MINKDNITFTQIKIICTKDKITFTLNKIIFSLNKIAFTLNKISFTQGNNNNYSRNIHLINNLLENIHHHRMY